MSEAWDTKYGRRRVRHDPPTLEDAVFAAQGLTEDPQAQAEIAASLMGLPVEKAREAVRKAAGRTTITTQPSRLRPGARGAAAAPRAVVVERRVVRRPATGRLATIGPMR